MAIEAWAASPLSRSARRGVTTRRSGSVVTPATMCPIRLPGEVIGAATVAVVPKSDSRLRPIPYSETVSGWAW